MKKLIFAATVFACGLSILAGCTKSLNPAGEEPSGNETSTTSGRIQLTTEGYKGDTKSSVLDNSVVWDDGDKVNINGTEYTVTVDSENAYIDGSGLGSGELKAHYPRVLLYDNTLTFPGNYTSTMASDGYHQSIALPMVAYDPAEAVHKYLHFYHASAAVQVMLWNTMTDRALHVERVVIKTQQYAVSGSCTIDPTNPSQAIAPVAASSDSERQVVVDFPGFGQEGELLLDPNEDDKSIQVPFRPIGAGDNMTIEVYCSDGSNNKYRYSYTQSCPALTRNQMMTAKVKLDLSGNMVQMVKLSSITGDYEAKDGDVLTGTLDDSKKLKIAKGATVTLAGMTHHAGRYIYGIECLGSATIILAPGTVNDLTRGDEDAYDGIAISNGDSDLTLTIEGPGTLNVSGGDNYAGINIRQYQKLVIKGGNITATGGVDAAGIGGGYISSYSCGDITIKGGAIVAIGGYRAAGIGCGYQSKCGNITITEGVTCLKAIKGEGNVRYYIGGSNSNCGTITVDGISKAADKITNPSLTTFDHFTHEISKTTYSNDTWTLTHI